jgi:hypothetical protein
MRFSLFGKKKPPETLQPTFVEDPYFGRVSLDKPVGWVGTRPFPPTYSNVDFALGGGPDGPTERQRDFFRLIEERYPELVEQYRARLVGEGERFTDGSSPQALFDSLQLQFVMLPAIGDGPVKWEMTYATDLDDHLITLRFTDWRFEEDHWDG